MKDPFKLDPDKKKFIFNLVEEALIDTDSVDAKPSEYYEELSVILRVFDMIKDDPELSDEDRVKISDWKLRIAEKMKLKAFW